MRTKKEKDSFPSVLAICLFVFVGLLNNINTDISLLNTFIFISSTTIYSGLIIAWIVYIRKRFISDRIRKILVSMAFFLLLYVFLRTVKYRYILPENYPEISRFLWYCYYIPQIFAPLISFVAAFAVGKSEKQKLSRIWIFIFIVAAILALSILTNDFHQLAFKFNENFENWNDDYSYGFLFYLVTAWIYLWLFACIIELWHKCKVESIKHRVWLPFIWLPVGTFLIVWLSVESAIGIRCLFRLPEIQCFILAAIWESCIQIGLIPCNTGYSEYFSNTNLAVKIADNDLNVVYQSKNGSELTKEQMLLAKDRSVLISKNTLLESNSVSGGRIFWLEDLSAVNNLNEELTEIGERLKEESDLLRAENEIREQKLRIEEQNRLYDSIAVLLKPQLDKIAVLLENKDDFQNSISRACVFNCYVKRRVNLTLIAYSNDFFQATELYLSIKESGEYLKLCGVSSFVRLDCDFSASSKHILFAFDFWQLLVEEGLSSGLVAIMADVLCDESGLRLNLNADGLTDLPKSEKYVRRLNALGGALSVIKEDETVFVSLFLPKGGEQK
ncbi:MAG: hypothetical protein ACI4GY_00905 [Acutalibacteraceae bacterium]